jgi:hypothetical protein
MSLKTAGEALSSREAFFNLYKDPRWKEFSARVRTFHANVCASCRASNKTTQVHHWKYHPGRNPWEYDMGEVVLLCGGCHDKFHELLQDFRKYIFPRVPANAFQVLNGALAVGLSKHDPLVLMYAIASLVASPGSVQRFADAWTKAPNEGPQG